MTMLRLWGPAFLWIALGFSFACSKDDPVPSDANDLHLEDPIQGHDCPIPPSFEEDLTNCQPLASDFRPREDGSKNDDWPACISDDNLYHKIEESVSSIARVQAYESIANQLWKKGATPTSKDFLAMRVLFEEEQGLGSRVARRYDVHYPKPPTGSCEEEGVAQQYPDYCVGQATIQPKATQAFAQGSLGRDRIVNARKIRALLQWFFYVSIIKEATTCTDTPKDCDSSWAYFAGGGSREEPAGLAFEIKQLAQETFDRIFDGILAVRCWKNLDHEGGVSEDLALRDRAILQLDRALLRGMALLARQRFLELACTTGDYQQATWEEINILVPLLDRATRERNPTIADSLLSQIKNPPEEIDIEACLQALDQTYPCP